MCHCLLLWAADLSHIFLQLKPSLQRGGSSASLHNSTMRNTIFQLMIHTLDPLGEGEYRNITMPMPIWFIYAFRKCLGNTFLENSSANLDFGSTFRLNSYLLWVSRGWVKSKERLSGYIKIFKGLLNIPEALQKCLVSLWNQWDNCKVMRFVNNDLVLNGDWSCTFLLYFSLLAHRLTGLALTCIMLSQQYAEFPVVA